MVLNRSRKSLRGRTEDGSPNPIDIHVGARVRLRRTLLGMSQEKLGEAIGLTFQQIQKYERGFNRIGASRLFDIGKVLEVPISFFFEEMDDSVAEDPVNFNYDPMSKRETLELVRAYYRIPDRHVAKKVFEMVKALARMDDVTDEVTDDISSGEE